jgi:transposase
MIPEAREVHLSRKDRKVLEACCRSPVTLQRDLKRARIVLLAAAGRSTQSIAKEVGVQPRIVSLWRHRYADHGLDGLQDKPRPGKQPIYTKATDKRILKLLDKPPPEGFARWTGPLLAGALGDVDVQYVWRFLRSHKIDLAARKSWCESNDPNFTAKAADVVGLYVAPPEKAIVLCVDEKPSIQAQERAQGYLKLPNGRALTGHSHDYKRHGTTTLFAALEVATGKIIATHSKRRRRVEFLDFMNSVTAAFPNRKQFVLDNLNTHNKNEHWLKAHPNVQVHFTPTSAYWLQSGRGMVLDLAGGSRLAAPPSQASNSSRSTSMPISKHITTKLSPSSGPRKRSVNAASKAAVSLSYDSEY